MAEIKISGTIPIGNLKTKGHQLPGNGFGFPGFSYIHLKDNDHQKAYFNKAQEYFNTASNFKNIEMFLPGVTGVKGDSLGAYVGEGSLNKSWPDLLVQPLDDTDFYRPFFMNLSITDKTVKMPGMVVNAKDAGFDYFKNATTRTNVRFKFTNYISQDFKTLLLVKCLIKLKIKCDEQSVTTSFAAFHKKDNTPNYYPTILVGGNNIDKDNPAPLSIDNALQYAPIGFLTDVTYTTRAKVSLVDTINNNGNKIPYSLEDNKLELTQTEIPINKGKGYRLQLTPAFNNAIKKINESIKSAGDATENDDQKLIDAINSWIVEYSPKIFDDTPDPPNVDPTQITITRIESYTPDGEDTAQISILTTESIPDHWDSIIIQYTSDKQFRRTNAKDTKIPQVAYRFEEIGNNHYRLLKSVWPITGDKTGNKPYAPVDFNDNSCFLKNYTDSSDLFCDRINSYLINRIKDDIRELIKLRIEYLQKNLKKELQDRINVLPEGKERKDKEKFMELLDHATCATTVTFDGIQDLESIPVYVDSNLIMLNNYINLKNNYYFDTTQKNNLEKYSINIKK